MLDVICSFWVAVAGYLKGCYTLYPAEPNGIDLGLNTSNGYGVIGVLYLG